MTDASQEGSAPDVTSASGAADPSPATQSGVRDGTERDYESEIHSLRSEAKLHRVARRAAEQERDQLRDRVDAHDRADVERRISDRLQTPSDLWLTVKLGDLRDESGELDADKLSERVDAVLADRPHWGVGRPDFSSGARRSIPPPPRSLGDAFKASLFGRG